ncbi:apurinic/apyrimidinic endonuclease family protein [Methanofollis fontis]|nr:hypothetical protein [Methanofollis fontis]
MKVGYSSANHSIGCSTGNSFDITAYSEGTQIWATAENLSCLARILEFNRKAGLHLFVLDTRLVPYAAHPVNTLDWAEEFAADFAALGAFIRESGIRIAMQPPVPFSGPGSYPGYYEYSAMVLRAMGLGGDARIPARAGDPALFGEQFDKATPEVKRRLALMNDDLCTVARCCEVARECGIPVMYNHYFSEDEDSVTGALEACARTWKEEDGLPLVRFSPRTEGATTPAHTLDPPRFLTFLERSHPLDFDLLIDFPDREQSALVAMIAAFEDPRLLPGRKKLRPGAV